MNKLLADDYNRQATASARIRIESQLWHQPLAVVAGGEVGGGEVRAVL
jgi:hypothetical protein